MSNLNYPVPEGGNAGFIVKVSADGHELIDGPFTTVATGATGAVTIPSYTTGSTTLPTTGTGAWLKIGLDTDGNQLFVPVFTIPA